MAEDIRKILGEFVSHEEKQFGGVDKYVISYKQPNSQDPAKVWKHQAVIDDLSDEAILIIDGASTGERFCVHQGKENGYPLITDITDAKDAPAKYSGGASKYKTGGGNYRPKDDTGAQVGNALNVAAITLGTGATEEEIEARAWNVIVIGNRLKTKLAAATTAKEATAEKAAEDKPKSRAELVKEKKATEAAKAKPPAKKAPVMEDDLIDDDSGEIEDDDLDTVSFD